MDQVKASLRAKLAELGQAIQKDDFQTGGVRNQEHAAAANRLANIIRRREAEAVLRRQQAPWD